MQIGGENIKNLLVNVVLTNFLKILKHRFKKTPFLWNLVG
jgi:hypothetical protein